MRIVDGLTRFSLRNATVIFLLVVLITAGGIYTAVQLKMESMPDIDIPVIAAVTPYPGASPNEVDEKVTKPVEQALQEMAGAKKVTSVSADSLSIVVVEFGFHTDLNQAQQEMKGAIEQAVLPKEAGQTSFNRYGFNTKPFMVLSVTSQTKPIPELEQWVKQRLAPTLKNIKEVGKVQIQGQSSKAVYVRLKQDQLKKHNLSVQQVQQALQGNNVTIPVGDVRVDDVVRPVQIDQKITSVEQLKNLRIPIYPNPQESMQKSMSQINQGFQGLGQSVGQLGQGLGQVGQGLGLLQAQVQLMQSAQQLQGKLLADQLALNAAQMWLKQNPDDEKAAATVATLKPKVDAETKALKQLNEKLKQLQNRMPRPKESPAGKSLPRQGNLTGDNTPSGSLKTVKLSQIASVTESVEDAPLITRVNGKPSVNIELIKNPDGNIVDAAHAVTEKVEDLKKQHPGLNISVLLDQSKMVKLSIHTIIREGLLGALFAVVVILLFLRNIRAVVISMVSIPLSILATLIFLKQADLSLNVMTLGGLAVAIGRIVDDSLVVIENIYRRLVHAEERNASLIQLATTEVASAITSSTLTTIVVFIPLGFIDGIVGKLFIPFALTIVFSLLCSLVVSITVVPLLAKLVMANGKQPRQHHEKSRLVSLYQRGLGWAFRHKATVIVSSTALFAASLCLIPSVGTSFIPSDQNRALQVNLELPSGTPLDATNKKAKEMETRLRSYPEIQEIATSVGNLNSPLTGDTNKISMFVNLTPTTDMKVFLQQIRHDLQERKENAELQVLEQKSIGPTANQIIGVVKGERIEDIRAVANELTRRMKQVKGLTNVTNNLSEQKELLNVDIDQQKASSEGLTTSQVAMSVRGLLQADKVNELKRGNQSMEIRLGLEKPEIDLVQKLKELQLLSPSGRLVKLGSIATIEEVKGPVKIQKENGQEFATVSGDAISQDTGALSQEVGRIIDGLKLPPGTEVTLGGDTQQMSESFRQIGMAIAVATFLVYAVMLLTFKEATTPFTILFSLPFAVIGGLVGLWISGLPISVAALIGALMLIGIVVTNAIVLLDRVRQQAANGLDMETALLTAAGTRLRPILMTACATVFALLPAGLGIGEGNAITQGLAVVVIGGLISSTLLTLFIVPVMYLLLSGISLRGWRKRTRPTRKQTQPLPQSLLRTKAIPASPDER